MSPISILVISGRKLSREGLTLLLKGKTGMKVVGEADLSGAGVKLVNALSVDVVVLNIGADVPEATGLISRLLAARDNLRVVVLPMYISGATLQALLKAGAHGCLTKDCSSAELVKAIRAVVEGGVCLPPSLTTMLVDASVTAAHQKRKVLASRELDVLRRIARGQTAKAIAADLQISVKTVETYRQRVMEKLNLHSVAELTQYAVANQLIPLQMTS